MRSNREENFYLNFSSFQQTRSLNEDEKNNLSPKTFDSNI